MLRDPIVAQGDMHIVILYQVYWEALRHARANYLSPAVDKLVGRRHVTASRILAYRLCSFTIFSDPALSRLI